MNNLSSHAKDFSKLLLFSLNTGSLHVPIAGDLPSAHYYMIKHPFGQFEAQQLLINVSCVSVHAKCIASHKTAADTISFLREGAVHPRPSRLGLSNYNVQGLDSPISWRFEQFSSAQWIKIWSNCTNSWHCVWQSALHHRNKQNTSKTSTFSLRVTLIQLHLLQALRTRMQTMVIPSCRQFQIYWQTSIHETIKGQGTVTGAATQGDYRTRKRNVHNNIHNQ